MGRARARERFLDVFRQFVLFHLGSDAEIRVDSSGSGLDIQVRHQRVRPMSLQFSGEEISALAEDRHRFEDRLLADLSRNRRS